MCRLSQRIPPPFGARGLAAGGPEERTAKNTEKLVEEVKGMRRDIHNGGAVFE